MEEQGIVKPDAKDRWRQAELDKARFGFRFWRFECSKRLRIVGFRV